MHKFLVMWCNEGLETLIDVTTMEQQAVIAVLKGEKIEHRNPIQYMILRAQVNPQRHYEIYVFESEFSEEEILDLFEDEPQTIVDAIRNVGNSLFSNRKTTKDVIT